MTVGELKDYLEYIDDDTPIKLAMQPNYPMVGSLLNVCHEMDKDDNCVKVWFACSGHQDYGCPREAWEESEIYPDEDDED